MVEIKYQTPHFTDQDACRIAQEQYGLEVSASLLPGDRDLNFYLRTGDGKEFVLKIAYDAEKKELLELQNRVMDLLEKEAPSLSIPRLCSTRSGDSVTTVVGKDGTSHLVRLLTYVPGRLLARVNPHTPKLLHSLGRVLGTIDTVLQTFDHPAAHRTLKWDLTQAGWIHDYIHYIKQPARRRIVENFLGQFESRVLPNLPALRSSVIYNDANDYNILISDGDPIQRTVIGVIDFGDLVYTNTICELAIALAYSMMGKTDPIAAAAQIVRGYNQSFPLTEQELAVLFSLACIRLCITVTNAAYQRDIDPGNEYQIISEQPAWLLLEKLTEINPRLAYYTFRDGCGMIPCPNAPPLIKWLSRHGKAIGPVVKSDLKTDKNLILDLSVASTDLGNYGDFENVALLTEKLYRRMKAVNADVGIGKYNEARPFYIKELYKIESDNGPHWRTVHLGIDIILEAGSEVFAPLDGTVHSLQIDNKEPRSVPTVILQHNPEKDITFYTLYSHLSGDTLKELPEGSKVKKGTCIGTIGNSSENGGWPPHLHFQLLCDMLGRKGEFPGLALPGERDLWTSICPDPNLVLGIPAECFTLDRLSSEQILAVRRQFIGRNLSISYQKPLTIVRGYMQYLYDDNGRQHLDCVNNVPCVGHSNPRVVRAAKAQMSVLNTNTRYLHENLVRYAERLCEMLMEPLSVCYIVCSGSEANELALRLARAYTQQKDLIVLDVSYHGNTTTLVDISPYKHDGPGGSGTPSFVHKVPTPDVYRGLYRKDDPQAGKKYARHIAESVEQIQKQGNGVSAFICEPIMGCAGQIVLPEGYLQEAFTHVRNAGGLCIADEVQVGFARVGTHFWAFETQGVVPDIVTLGKPIGNGHPLAAVVTTPDIAASFDNGMEYFNTFGGNPVSCAVGLAVLDEIAEKNLQENALETGNYLLDSLRKLMDKYPLIGDVRGLGLFIGIELVLNRDTLEPAAEQATYLINRMKEHGILLSTDGPYYNVIKIKPPLVFTKDNADFVVSTFEKVLKEDFLTV